VVNGSELAEGAREVAEGDGWGVHCRLQGTGYRVQIGVGRRR
jgi:hypothetical protein